MKDKLKIVLQAVYEADRRGTEAIPATKIISKARNKITMEDIYEVAFEGYITEASYYDRLTGTAPLAYKIMPQGMQYLVKRQYDWFLVTLTILGLIFSLIAAITGILQVIGS
mgnify:CR=1 FL=1